MYHIISYHIISYHIISYHIVPYHITSHHIISYHVISYHIISYHIISYHIISYHILSYHIYHIISYHILSYGTATKQSISARSYMLQARSKRQCKLRARPTGTCIGVPRENRRQLIWCSSPRMFRVKGAAIVCFVRFFLPLKPQKGFTRSS